MYHFHYLTLFSQFTNRDKLNKGIEIDYFKMKIVSLGYGGTKNQPKILDFSDSKNNKGKLFYDDKWNLKLHLFPLEIEKVQK